MENKKPVSSHKTSKVIIELDKDILQEIDNLIKKFKENDIKISRSGLCKNLINTIFSKNYCDIEEQITVHNLILFISKALIEKSNESKDSMMSSFALLAASKEMEALSIFKDKNENLIKSSVINIVQLLKKATGYKSLPDIPIMVEKKVIS